MGLCKCPKRKVTNLFCFEHRVNVCESCLLANHESCVVQTYLSWLTDSDYDANCPLCFEPLNSKETVRLKCLHLFHWDCFNARARQLPDTTAPAGYKCPSCLECIFPSENQQSPVVDKLRIRLQSVNWGRLGIGLASLPELDQKTPSAHLLNSSANSFNGVGGQLPPHYHQPQHPSPPSILNDIPNNNIAQRQYDDPFEMNTFTARTKLLTESNGSLSSSVYIGNGDGTGADNLEESKYAKKAASERNIRQRFARLPRSLKRIFLAIAAVGLVYLILQWMNSDGGGNGQGGQEDPLFDPHANPNIRVERQQQPQMMEGAKGES